MKLTAGERRLWMAVYAASYRRGVQGAATAAMAAEHAVQWERDLVEILRSDPERAAGLLTPECAAMLRDALEVE